MNSKNILLLFPQNVLSCLLFMQKNTFKIIFLYLIFFSIQLHGQEGVSDLTTNKINLFGEVISHKVYSNAVKFSCALEPLKKDTVSTILSFPSVDVVKVQVNIKGFEPIDEESIPFLFTMKGDEFRLKTDSLLVIIKKDKWGVDIYRSNGNLLYSEESGKNGLVLGENHKISISAHMQHDEHFYGFGEKFNGFDQRGKKVVMELDDAFASTDGKTYISIPFFISSKQYGLLVNSAQRIVFHMGNLSDTSYSFEIPDDKLEYYIFTNKDPLKIISQYTSVTGRSPLIPKWSLEPWLSRRRITGWEDVKTAEKDIDLILKDGYRLGVIMWEGIRSLFKGEQASQLHALSDKWHELGIKQVFWSQEGHENLDKILNKNVPKNYFILNQDSTYSIGTRYGGSAYVDPTNPEAMQWWKDNYYQHALSGINGTSKPGHWNLDGIKIDFCEFFPKEDSKVLLNKNTKGMHNLHPVLFSEQIYNWLQEIKPEGGITWVRGGGLGLQRVGYSWGGDRLRNFPQLKGTVSASLAVSVCGVSLIGHDLGGYWGGDSPDSRETYIRGVQYATFSPAFHDHGSAPAPWEQDEYGKENYRFYSRVRYNILPYLYQYVKISHEEGIPIMRALYLHHPNDPNTFDIDDEYYLGNELLIAPFTHLGNNREIYLPKGKWIDFWSQEEYMGHQNLTYGGPLNRIPVFAKKSSIIPLRLNSHLELGGIFPQKEKNNLLLSFRFFKGGNAEYNFYNNDGSIRVEKYRNEKNTKVEIKNIKEPFGLVTDGLLPASIAVNGRKIEKLSKHEFCKTMQGWRYDSLHNQTLIKIDTVAGINQYSVDIDDFVEIKNLKQNAMSQPSPIIKQAVGWDKSITLSFDPVVPSEYYIIKYWTESGSVKNEIKVTDSPATISGLNNGVKYNLVVYSANNSDLSEGSSVESAIPVKRNAFFIADADQLFIHAGHFLTNEKLDDGSQINTYGFLSSEQSNYSLWVKACKKIKHHLYFRWYKVGEVSLNKGLNYVSLKLLKPRTEIERIYLTSSNEERPVLKDEVEGAFIVKDKFKVRNEKLLEF